MPKCFSSIVITKPSGHKQSVPCGKCEFCLVNKRQDWQFRLTQEMKIAESAHFLTMTYDEENLPLQVDTETGEFVPTLNKKDVQLFLKRLREKNIDKSIQINKYKTRKQAWKQTKQLRYYAIGEYGTDTERAHYHAIMFNLQKDMEPSLEQIWQMGYLHTGSVTPQSIAYVCKYSINKHYYKGIGQKPFAIMSKRPAIGHNYLENAKYHQENETIQVKTNGVVQRLPQYYKDKFFTSEDKERLQKAGEMPALQREIAERKRILKLGNEPYKYQGAQREVARAKIRKNNKNNQKL